MNRNTAAHQMNVDAAQREIDRRAAEGEPMDGAYINPRTYAIEFPARTLSRATRNAVAKYGRDKCVRAAADHIAGNGASTIGFELGLTTRQADAAIEAGIELRRAGA